MEINKVWNDLVVTSNQLIKNYKKDDNATKKDVKNFLDHLVELSETFVSDRSSVLMFLKNKYPKLILNASNLVSAADSVAVIMQANEGINDYLLLVNVFRGLLVGLDAMASAYWLKISEGYYNNSATLPVLIRKSNYAVFDKNEEEEIELLDDVVDDKFFNDIMNKQLWKEIKNLDENYILKNQENFEYIKELLISSEQMADDMVINLWAVLAVGFSYLDYLNNLLGE